MDIDILLTQSGHTITDGLVKLGLAIVIGLLIGWEREYHENVPGLRVMPLVCAGATLFTLAGGVTGSVTGTTVTTPAIAAGVVTGVGFLGAGVIMRERGVLSGLVTAAVIWVTAAMGMAIAFGAYIRVGFVAAAVLLILWVFPSVAQAHHSYVYTIVFPYSEVRRHGLAARFEEKKIKITKRTISREGGEATCVWHATGAPEQHRLLIQDFLNDPEVTHFSVE